MVGSLFIGRPAEAGDGVQKIPCREVSADFASGNRRRKKLPKCRLKFLQETSGKGVETGIS